MRKYPIALTALLFALVGCTPQPRFPWSLKGKTIPTFSIQSKEDLSLSGTANYAISVVVSDELSKNDLALVSKKIIEGLPKHSMVNIFYYADPAELKGEFTIGKAWWGLAENAAIPVPGDYTHHILKIERKPKKG